MDARGAGAGGPAPVAVLSPHEWRLRTAAHEARVRPWADARLERRRRGERHPVDDFLWEYYRLRPARLLQWHPGLGTVLAGDPPVAGRAPYVRTTAGWTAVPDPSDASLPRIGRSLRILRATAGRSALTGCFGMHEWAMVLGAARSDLRHPRVPLRLSPREIREVVGDVGLRCTHFDAYRFFTGPARGLQRPLTRADQQSDEQPGCLHAGMDLYRYSYEALPFVGSDLVADCLAHARTARELDMAASPYDLSEWGLGAIAMETPAGRREYALRQTRLATTARELRRRVIDALERVSGTTTAGSAALRGPDAAQSVGSPVPGRIETAGD